MMRASEHAGSIGLIYQADENNFCRVVVSDSVPSLPERPAFPGFPARNTASEDASSSSSSETDLPDAKDDAPSMARTDAVARVETPLIPRRPEAPERPALPNLPDTDKTWKFYTSVKSAVGWLASVFVGLFVGYGLFRLVGGNEKRSPGEFYVALAIGVGVIVGIKLLMDVLWGRAGRLRAQGERHGAYLGLASGISVLMLAVEAFLGGKALEIYTNKTHYGGQGGLSIWLCVLLATGISTATLLLSGVVGYQKGERSLTTEDLETRRHAEERAAHVALVNDLKADHERNVAEWEAERVRLTEIQEAERQWNRDAVADAREAHTARLAQYEEWVRRRMETHDEGVKNREERMKHYESLRTLPEFQELCKYISVVGSLNVRIKELESKDTGVAIGRGRGWQDAY